MALSDSLRAAARARRRAVSPAARALAAQRVARFVDRHFSLRPGARVALYAALPEELDTGPLIERALRRGCQVYLPRITDYRARRMTFREIGTGSGAANRYGIVEPEPDAGWIGVRWLDIAFVPLVAFDSTGTRIGMGGGFYDRAFAYRRLRRTWRGPLLVGLAYEIQRVPAIAAAAHDVRLDAIVTEEGVTRCSIG